MDVSLSISVTKLRILEFTTFSSVLASLLCHILLYDTLWIAIPSFIFIICGIIFLFLLDIRIFLKVVLRQFRSCIVFSSVCITIIIDFTAIAMLHTELKTSEWMTACIGSIIWFLGITLLLMSDCIFPKLSNISRFMLPFIAVINASYNIYLTYEVYPDHAIITLQHGTVTLRTIQRVALAQIIWFCATLMVRVFLDPYHEQYQFIDFPIPRSKHIDFDDHEITSICNGKFSFQTKYIFIFIFIWLISVNILYGLNNVFVDNDIIQFNIWGLTLLFTIIGITLFVILYMNHFQRDVWKLLLRQFRFHLLVISMFLLSGCVIYHSILFNIKIYGSIHIDGVFIQLSFVINFNLAIFIFMIRDGLQCVIPYWFMVSFGIIGWILTLYNIYSHTFMYYVEIYPVPTLFLEKEAIIQLWLLITLISYNIIIKDRKHLQFTLIRQRVKRTRNHTEIIWQSQNLSTSIDVDNDNDKTMSLLQEYDTKHSMEMNAIRFSVNNSDYV